VWEMRERCRLSFSLSLSCKSLALYRHLTAFLVRLACCEVSSCWGCRWWCRGGWRHREWCLWRQPTGIWYEVRWRRTGVGSCDSLKSSPLATATVPTGWSYGVRRRSNDVLGDGDLVTACLMSYSDSGSKPGVHTTLV
jgi:hypothetical protein